MSSGSLFEEEKSNSLSRIYLVIGLIGLVIAGVIGYFAYQSNQEKVKIAKDIRVEEEYRDTTINLLTHPRFSGDEFRTQILGKGRLERYERVNEDLYFTYPPSNQQEFDGALAAGLDEEPHLNPNTGTNEFTLRDPDGYYVTVSALPAG